MAMTEYGVPVVFDVESDSYEHAAEEVAAVLMESAQVVFGSGNKAPGYVQSWWLPEQEAKHVDGNDNADMTLVNRERLQALVDAWDTGDIEGLQVTIDKLRAQCVAPAMAPGEDYGVSMTYEPGGFLCRAVE